MVLTKNATAGRVKTVPGQVGIGSATVSKTGLKTIKAAPESE